MTTNRNRIRRPAQTGQRVDQAVQHDEADADRDGGRKHERPNGDGRRDEKPNDGPRQTGPKNKEINRQKSDRKRSRECQKGSQGKRETSQREKEKVQPLPQVDGQVYL